MQLDLMFRTHPVKHQRQLAAWSRVRACKAAWDPSLWRQKPWMTGAELLGTQPAKLSLQPAGFAERRLTSLSSTRLQQGCLASHSFPSREVWISQRCCLPATAKPFNRDKCSSFHTYSLRAIPWPKFMPPQAVFGFAVSLEAG